MNKYFQNQNAIVENQVYSRKKRASSYHCSNAQSIQSMREGEKIYPFRKSPGNSPQKHNSQSMHQSLLDSGQEITRSKEQALLCLRLEKIGQCLEIVYNGKYFYLQYRQQNPIILQTLYVELDKGKSDKQRGSQKFSVILECQTMDFKQIILFDTKQ